RNRTLRRLRGAIAGSEGAAALVRRLVPGLRVGVIPQLGVHVPTEPEHAYHDGLAIGCVGRLVPEKGIDTLLQALAENRAHRWHLTVVGDGPDRERLERLASDLRLAARGRCCGADASVLGGGPFVNCVPRLMNGVSRCTLHVT